MAKEYKNQAFAKLAYNIQRKAQIFGVYLMRLCDDGLGGLLIVGQV